MVRTLVTTVRIAVSQDELAWYPKAEGRSRRQKQKEEQGRRQNKAEGRRQKAVHRRQKNEYEGKR